MDLRSIIRAVLPSDAYRAARKLSRDTKRILRRAGSVEILPHTAAFDTFIHKRNFIRLFGREPSPTSMLLSDYLFRLKTGRELTNPLRVRISDKEHVKEYVRQRVGDDFNVPTIRVLRSYQEALRFAFPVTCAIKPTHASMQVILRKKGEPIDFDRIDFWFDHNYYRHGFRESNYRDLIPKVIVEPLIFNRDDVEDYKFFCWRGEPKFIQVDLGRFTNHRRAYLDTEWRSLPFSMNYPEAPSTVDPPRNLQKMCDVAGHLSAPFSFIRVDLYSDGDDINVGELTNCPEGGNVVFRPENGEEVASKLLFGADLAMPARSP